MPLTDFSRCFLSGEHRKGVGKNITKPRFDRVILAGCVCKWQGVLPLFTFDAVSLPFHSAHSSSASKETRPFSIALRPSLSQLSDIIIPSINFASAPVPDIAGDARELDILPFSSRSRQTNRSIERKCDSSAAKTSITLSRWTCPDRAREDRFRKRIYLPFGTISHGIYFSKGECFWKKLCAGHFCREERFSSRAGFLLLISFPYEEAFTARVEKGFVSNFSF